MQLLEDLRGEAAQLRVLGLVVDEVRLELALGDPPLAAPDDEAHLLDAHLAEQPLAVGVEVGGRGEVAVGLDAAVEELAKEADNAERGAEDLGHDWLFLVPLEQATLLSPKAGRHKLLQVVLLAW